MAELVVGPIMEKIINTCSDYLEDEVGQQTGMKKELERVRENHPKIQAVAFAAKQAQISDQNPAFNKWIWQLRDAIDEADDVLDEFEYTKHKEQLTKNTEETKVVVSNNFDVKKVIADMLESLKKERPRLETLGELQGCLEVEVMPKKFLLVLDDIWEEDEEKDKNKWEDVLVPLASGGFGSKILVTTRTDSVALMFLKVIKKNEKIVKLEGLEEDECLELLNSHAFAGVQNPPDDHKNLIAIAGETVKKLLGSPLAAKVIGGVLNGNLDEKHWRAVLESNLLDQNSIRSILRLSYIVLPNHLQNCFAFCCMFLQNHTYHKDDLV